MDDDDRYNRKLEAGLYTLQVLAHGICNVVSDICFSASFCLGSCLPYEVMMFLNRVSVYFS